MLLKQTPAIFRIQQNLVREIGKGMPTDKLIISEVKQNRTQGEIRSSLVRKHISCKKKVLKIINELANHQARNENHGLSGNPSTNTVLYPAKCCTTFSSRKYATPPFFTPVQRAEQVAVFCDHLDAAVCIQTG